MVVCSQRLLPDPIDTDDENSRNGREEASAPGHTYDSKPRRSAGDVAHVEGSDGGDMDS